MASESFTTMPGPGELDSVVVHDQYFWEFLTFKVENTLFRLPSYRFLTESECFASIHGIPTQFQEEAEPPNPIQEFYTLDTTLREFEHMLKVLYPLTPAHRSTKTQIITEEEWTSILKLSSLWFFEDLRKKAISKLTDIKMDPIRRVCLAKQFNIERWLLSGYKELVELQPSGPRTLTEEEAQKIGWQTALSLSNIVIRRQHDRICTRLDRLVVEVEEDIRRVFAAEFDRMEAAVEQRRAVISLHSEKLRGGSAGQDDTICEQGDEHRDAFPRSPIDSAQEPSKVDAHMSIVTRADSATGLGTKGHLSDEDADSKSEKLAGGTSIPSSKSEDSSDSDSASLSDANAQGSAASQSAMTAGKEQVHQQILSGDQTGDGGSKVDEQTTPKVEDTMSSSHKAPLKDVDVFNNPWVQPSPAAQRQAPIPSPQPRPMSKGERLVLGLASAVSNARQRPAPPRVMIQTMVSDVAKALGT